MAKRGRPRKTHVSQEEALTEALRSVETPTSQGETEPSVDSGNHGSTTEVATEVAEDVVIGVAEESRQLPDLSTFDEATDPWGRKAVFLDFRVFMCHVWRSLRLPDPTDIQYDIAAFLQHGPDRRGVMAFRGVGKSWITAAYTVWRLYWQFDRNVLTVSASKQFADNSSTFTLQIIRTTPGLEFLDCVGKERHSKLAFDVGPAPAQRQPSVISAGIFGQLTGSRADDIIADDIETAANSLTDAARLKLTELTREFPAIVKPGGRVSYLFTPQSAQSIYLLLQDKGYNLRVWPAEYPDARLLRVYGDTLAPMIREAVERNPSLAGQPTEPSRFPEEELEKKRMEMGRSGYALQMLLDTSLADANKYPLKLKDLIIYPCRGDAFPDNVQWSPMQERRMAIPSPGFGQDGFYEPIVSGTAFSPYTGSAMFVDPSGTGKDETAWAVGRHSHGRICIPEWTGVAGGYSDAVLTMIAETAKRYQVNVIVVEANFGDGAFSKLLQPHVQRIYPCLIEDVKVTKQKELRIIQTLEPAMNQHRIIMDPGVLEADGHRDSQVSAEDAPRYRGFWQMTRLTAERGCLAHDDRIDALAGLVAYWVESLAKDVRKSVSAHAQAEWERDLREGTDALFEIGKRPRYVSLVASNKALEGRKEWRRK